MTHAAENREFRKLIEKSKQNREKRKKTLAKNKTDNQ